MDARSHQCLYYVHAYEAHFLAPFSNYILHIFLLIIGMANHIGVVYKDIFRYIEFSSIWNKRGRWNVYCINIIGFNIKYRYLIMQHMACHWNKLAVNNEHFSFKNSWFVYLCNKESWIKLYKHISSVRMGLRKEISIISILICFTEHKIS